MSSKQINERPEAAERWWKDENSGKVEKSKNEM